MQDLFPDNSEADLKAMVDEVAPSGTVTFAEFYKMMIATE